MPKDSSTYQKIVDHMDNHNMAFRTLQLKENRAFRVVIKGLHSTTPAQYIIEELKGLGHIVRDIKNAVSRITTNPMAMFFVNLEAKRCLRLKGSAMLWSPSRSPESSMTWCSASATADCSTLA